MNTPNNEMIVSVEEAWRYDAQERAAMIANGYRFETPLAPSLKNDGVPAGVAAKVNAETQVFRDAAGKIITAERADELRFVFQNIDEKRKMNGLGEISPRVYA